MPIRQTDGTPGIHCPLMSSEQVSVGPVELNYTLTEDDWLDGFIAHRRRVRRPWLVPVLIVAALVGLLIGRVISDGSRAMSAADVAALATVALVGVGLGLLLFRFLVAARWMYRWQVRLIMRGNPWLSEPIRATVDDTGLRKPERNRRVVPIPAVCRDGPVVRSARV